MVKLAVTAILTVIASANMSGQGDTPLVREGVKWHYMTVCEAFEFPIHHYCFFDGYKEIDGMQYKMCTWISLENNDTTAIRHFYLRQDKKKVFLRRDSLERQRVHYPDYVYMGDNCDKACTDRELLIYDFSLIGGQSWKLLQNYTDTSESDSYYNRIGAGNIMKINSIGSMNVCGIDTKVQYVYSALARDKNIVVVEGIGTVTNNVFPLPYRVDLTARIAPRYTYLESLEDSEGNVLYSRVNGIASQPTRLSVKGNRLSVDAEGDWSLTVFGVDGSKAGTYRGNGPQSIEMPYAKGLYVAVLADRAGSQKLKFVI